MPNNKPLYTLYEGLKANNYDVPDNYESFERTLTEAGKGGADSRHTLYNALKEQNYDVPDSYEHFYNTLFTPVNNTTSRAKGTEEAARPASRPQPKPSHAAPAARPQQSSAQPKRSGTAMTEEEREQMAGAVGGMVSGTRLQLAQGARQRRFQQANTGLNVKRTTIGDKKSGVQLGQNSKVVKEKSGQWNTETGRPDESYLTESGNEYEDRSGADLEQNAVDEARFQTEQQEAYLNQRKAQLMEEMEQRGKELDTDTGGGFGWGDMPHGGGGAVHTYNAATLNGRASDERYQTLKAEMSQIDDALANIAEAKKGKASDAWINDSSNWAAKKGKALLGFGAGAWRGLVHSIGSVSTWDMGASDLSKNAAVLKAAKNAERYGIDNISDEDRNLLNMTAYTNAVNSESAKHIGWGYEAGEVTGTSLPFMLEMVLNPASGLGQASQKALMRFAVKKFGKDAVKKAAKKYLAGKIGARVLGDVAGSAIMAGTTGQGHVTADMLNRMTGDVKFGYDRNGKIVYNGRENADDGLTAYLKAFAAQTIENHSEMVGEYFKPVLGAMGKAIGKGVNKLAGKANWSKFTLDKVNSFINGVGATETAKMLSNFEKHAQWHGSFAEYAEEVVGNAENALIVGDNTFDTQKDTGVFNLEQNIKTFLGVGLMSGFFAGVKTASYRGAKRQALNEMVAAGREVDRAVAGSNYWTEQWGKWRSTFLVGTDEEKEKTLREVLDNGDLPMSFRRGVLNFVKASQKYEGLARAQESKAQEGSTDPIEGQQDASYDEGYDADDEQKKDIKVRYDSSREELRKAMGVDEKGFAPEKLDLVSMARQDQRESVRNAALKYLNAKAAYEGMINGVQDGIEDAIDASNAEIDRRVNKDTGTIETAQLKDKNEDGSNKTAYVVGGQVVLNGNGEVDNRASDQSIIIMHPDTGEMEMVSPNDISGMSMSEDPEQAKQTAAEEIRRRKAQEAANVIDDVPQYGRGDYAVMTDESGKSVEVQIQNINEDGVEVAVVGNNGEPTRVLAPIDKSSFEGLVQSVTDGSTGEERWKKHVPADVANKANGTNEADKANKSNDVDKADNGSDDGSLTPPTTEDLVRMARNGDELAQKQLKAQGVSWDGEGSTEQGANVAESESNNGAQPTAMERVPKDEKGQPLFEQADPGTAWDAIVEDAEGDEEMAAKAAAYAVEEKERAVKAKESALKKAQKAQEGDMGNKPMSVHERIAAMKEAKKAVATAQAELDTAQAELAHWKQITLTPRQRQMDAKKAINDALRRAAEAKAEREAKAKAEREEAERKEREALEGVPDWTEDTPQAARARGYRRADGAKYDRQENVPAVQGKEVEVKFSDKVKQEGHVAVMDAGRLQPSHVNGQNNVLHFIPEAQPKKRTDAASMMSADEIAANINPEEITSSVTAYTGAPTVNTRGEVIQGNNRSAALKTMWQSHADEAAKYKQYLIDHAGEFGLKAEDIEKMQNPVLVNMVDVDDAKAIELGQYDVKDTESGGTERIKAKNAVQKMGEDMKTFAGRLLASSDEDSSFSQLVDKNGMDVLKWMNAKGYITATQYKSAFDSKGNLTAEAANDLKGIMYQSIFRDGTERLEEKFNTIPAKAQRAILATAYRDYDSPEKERMVPEIQNSIEAYYELMQDESFAGAKTMKEAQMAVMAWQRQYKIDDATGESYLPTEKYSNFALQLAAMYKVQTQSLIQGTFNQMFDLIQGTQEADLFNQDADNTPRSLAEAIKEVLNIEYNGQQRSDVLGGRAETGQQRRQGSTGAAEADGRGESGERDAEREGGAGRTDNGQGRQEYTGDNAPRQGDLAEAGDVDENGHSFVKSSDGTTVFGEITEDSGLTAAPIKLSEGFNSTDEKGNNIGYGLLHIQAGHGEQILKAGYPSVEKFVEDVCRNYKEIRIGRDRKSNQTYMLLELHDEKHKRTLYVELSHDGTYWNVNSGGIFKNKYTDKNDIVWPEPTVGSNANTDTAEVADSPTEVTKGETVDRGGNSSQPISSGGKNTQKSAKEQAKGGKSADGKVEKPLSAQIDAASAEVNTNPTEGQKEAGNYKKGHVQVGTFDVTIEQPEGSVRRGTDANGKKWESKMHNTYGYFRGTEGVDGDHIDVFLSNDIDGWNGRKVYVVDQYNPDGTFDEHKVMLGFNDMDEAKSDYLANYEKGWEDGRRIDVSSVNLEDFEKWVESSHRKTKPFAEYAGVQKETTESKPSETSVSLSTTEAGDGENNGYTITPSTYTNKKGKTSDVSLLTFDHDLTAEQERAVKEFAKERTGEGRFAPARGWKDRDSGGWMFRKEEDARKAAEMVGSEESVADNQPLSISDLRETGEAPAHDNTQEDVFEKAERIAKEEQAKRKAEKTEKPKNEGQFGLVSDERMEELKKLLRAKLHGQANSGIPPEVLAYGIELAAGHIDRGIKTFADFAKVMIADLGEVVRPYLKAFYNGVRDMPEVVETGLSKEMTPYEEVSRFDVANFDKDVPDALATAEQVVAEEKAQKQAAEASEELKRQRNAKRAEESARGTSASTAGTSASTARTSASAATEARPATKQEQKEAKAVETAIKEQGKPQEKPKKASELTGDSAAWQEREKAERSLVSEIGIDMHGRAMASLRGEEVKPLTMADVKKMVAKYPALKDADMSVTDLQELVELATVNAARITCEMGKLDAEGYKKVVALYEAQPLLNARDSTRVERQQYSTPIPFGYVMGMFANAGREVKTVLEPSAGNGALTITFDAKNVHVNDIDERRVANLRTQGFGEVTTQDALQPFGERSVDVVMTNPPFGSVVQKEYDGGMFKVGSLEGQMAINALESMKDDGRAAIVIGGNTEYRKNGVMQAKDMQLFGYLYTHYNVVDVINLDGAMYGRNGTKYNVRMILIDGRKTGELKRVIPPVESKARAEQVKTFDELFNRVNDDILQLQQMDGEPSRDSGEATATDRKPAEAERVQNNREDAEGREQSVRGSEGERGEQRAPQPDGVDTRPRPGRRGGDEQRGEQDNPAELDNGHTGDAGSPHDVQGQRAGGVGQRPGRGADRRERVGSGAERGSAADGHNTRGERLEVKLTDEKVPYPNRSQSGTLMSVVPAAQAQALEGSLAEIGDVDQYLVDQLGYSGKDELFGYLAAEQIDSVALAIHQMSKGNAFIIGDMTGVGKGRQGAALIRYAVKHGKKPIYFTQKSALFSDNYRDLCDIGSEGLRPFIMASRTKEHTENITDADGNLVYKLPTDKERERVYAYIKEHGTLPDEYDYMITTYSQIQNGMVEYVEKGDRIEERQKKNASDSNSKNGQERRDVIAALAKNNVMVLDESHTVGGEGGGAMFMRSLMPGVDGVTFLSATFAKRPDNMPLYAMRTAIAESGLKPSEMIQAIADGGVTLQEVMSKQLVQSGQMIRRERNFKGVTIDWLPVEEQTDRVQRERFDEVAGIFSAIRAFQDDYIKPLVDQKSDDIAEQGGYADIQKGTEAMGVKNVPFASKMYNLVNQLLFALKADAVADRVIWNLRHGYKPVISFTNTMEGFLSEAPKDTPMSEIPNFSLTLMKALDGVMRYSTTDVDGNKENSSFLPSDLSKEGQAKYEEIRERIKNLSSDLSISPMDAIKMKIEAAGYSVGEITGRTTELAKDENGLYVVRNRTDRDKKAAARDFNNGKLDVLMINKSGSTGISLHASPKFGDTRQRVMVFAQFQSDINDEVQMRGRIDRTGQLTRGKYEYIMSSIPAEQRLQMMFKAKLKSLDANTTSSQKSKFNEMEVVDYLNKYGDEVTWQYMLEHPELEERLGDPLEMLGKDESKKRGEGGSKKEDCSGKIARHLPFLSVKEQEEIFKEITEAYQVKMQMLDEAGENDLEITTMPLRAETKKRTLWKEGTAPNSGNAFADNTYLEEVEVDVLKKPMKASEVESYASRLTGGEDFAQWRDAKTQAIDEAYAQKAEALEKRMMAAADLKAGKLKAKIGGKAMKLREQGKNTMTDEEIAALAQQNYDAEMANARKKIEAQIKSIEARRDMVQKALGMFEPMEMLAIPFDLSSDNMSLIPGFGTLLGYKLSKDFSPSSSTAVFATLDGRRKVELPLTQVQALKAIQTATLMQGVELRGRSMSQWDSYAPTKTRRKAYIVTGNLMQALVDTKKGENTKGHLISYSTIDGETRQGILMPENFKPSDLRYSAPISSKLDDIRRGVDVKSEDGKVQIKTVYGWRSGYELRVPKSKQSGSVYFEDKSLRKLVRGGEFTTRGNAMVAEVAEENIGKVLDRLSKLGVTVLAESNIEEKEGDVLYRNGGESMEEVNGRFNSELARYQNGEMDKNEMLHLGRPQGVMRAFLPDLPIVMRQRILTKGSVRKHNVAIEALADMPNHLSYPIFVFKRSDNALGVLTEMQDRDGKNVCVAIELNRQIQNGGEILEVNDIRSVHGRNVADIVYPIVQNGTLKWADKEKGLAYLSSASRYVQQEIDKQDLNAATKVVENFVNPKISDENVADDEILYRIVDDKSTVERLEREPKMKAYRAMQVIGDKLYSPMAAKVDGKLTSDNPMGVWTEAEETVFDFTPEQKRAMEALDNSGKKGDVEIIKDKLRYHKGSEGGKGTLQFHLVKGDGTSLWAAYNPYIHSSMMMLNDQFTSAYKRPNIVVVEVEIPESELTSGYRAERAKDPVGMAEWKAGPVAGQLPSDMGRKVMLSRWSKVKRIVPYSEVADHVAAILSAAEAKKGEKLRLPIDSFHPELRKELEKRGYEFEAGQYTKEKTDKNGNVQKAWDEQSEAEKQKSYKGAVYMDDAQIARLNAKLGDKWMQREGNGSYTDEELSQANDPTLKMTGRSRYTAKQRREYAERERRNMVEHLQELTSRLHLDNVEIVTDASTLEGRQKKAKGFYNTRTGKITIVVPNHLDMEDAEQTLLHEAVAHYGLRQLFGRHFDEFLDNVYTHAAPEVFARIREMAKAHGWDFRTATEEYLASLAEDTDFERVMESRWWMRVKQMFLKMLHDIGFGGRYYGPEISDNELRYILWRSYENLKEPGRYRSILGEAEDVAKQAELKVGNYAEEGTNTGLVAERQSVTTIAEMKQKVTELFEKAKTGEFAGKPVSIGRLSADGKTYLEKMSGVKMKNFVDFVLNPSDLNHIRSDHYGENEKDKGNNVPLTDEDIQNLVDVLNHPDGILYGVDKKDGRKLFFFMKDAGNGLYNLTEVCSTKKGNLTAKSFFKSKKKGISQRVMEIKASLLPTSVTYSGESLSSDAKIPTLFETNEISSENVENDVLFRDGDAASYDKALARGTYEMRVKSGMYQMKEAMLDSMASLEALMLSVTKAEGKKLYIEDIEGFENPYLGENRLSSVNQAESEAFKSTLIMPMLEEVARLAKTADERAELTDYMMAKHGLERNEEMARRDAENKSEKEFEVELREAERRLAKDPLDQDAADALADVKQRKQDREDELYLKNRERDYAGLTSLTGEKNVADAEDEARHMVTEYELFHDTDELWRRVNAVNDAILSKSYESGMISKAVYDKIRGMYKWYIPLRGFDEKTSEEEYAYINGKTSAFNAPIKSARGRKSKADDPFANMCVMADSAIMQGNRNTLVKQKLMNFVVNHPSDLVSISNLWLRYDDVADEWHIVNSGDVAGTEAIESDDSAADVERKMRDFEDVMEQLSESAPDHFKKQREHPEIPYRVVHGRDLKEHQVVVKRNGKDYVLTINGNPRAAQAVNGLTNPDNRMGGSLGAVVEAIGNVNRGLSLLYTSLQPDFVVSNFLRDTLYSNTMVWIKESPEYAARYNVNYAKTKRVMSLLGKYRKGTLDMNDETEKMFAQFMKNGGETGFLRMAEFDKRKKEIRKALDKATEKIPKREVAEHMATWIGEIGRGIEMRSRFAAFMTSREMGRTIDRSIWDAKEISVNFNKKGAADKMLGATGQTLLGDTAAGVAGFGRTMFIFWNASLQGTFGNFGKYAIRHPKKMTAAVATSFALGLLVAALAASGGGGDGDDDDNSYFDIPKHVRRQNLIIKGPGKTWIKVPLPMEYRAVYGMGELAGSTLFHNEELELGDMVGQVSQLLPVDLMEGWGGLYPSSVKPIKDVSNNKTWYGTPIWKESEYNKYMPRWTKAYKSANPDLVNLAAVLNDKTGGDKYSKGVVDINPAAVEYLLKQYTGGFFTLTNQLRNMADVAEGKKDFDWRYVPLANRVLMTGGDEATAGRGLNEKFFKYLDGYKAMESRISAIKRDHSLRSLDKAELITEVTDNPVYKVLRRANARYSKLNKTYKVREEQGEDAEVKRLAKEILKTKRELVEAMEKQEKGEK